MDCTGFEIQMTAVNKWYCDKMMGFECIIPVSKIQIEKSVK